jgi:HK97 gp10 family phage protein
VPGSFEIEGMRQLAHALRELPVRLARNDLQAAAVAGAAVIRDDARIKAPVYTGDVSQGHPAPGTLKKSIILKNVPEQSDNQKRVVYVTVRHGKKFQRYGKKQLNVDAFYWFFVEFGTRHMSARPFMRPAFEAQKRAAIDAVKSRLEERVAAHAQDLAW